MPVVADLALKVPDKASVLYSSLAVLCVVLALFTQGKDLLIVNRRLLKF